MADPISPLSDTLPKEYLTDSPSIDTLRKRFDEARELTQDARMNPRHGSQTCRDWFDGPEQLNSETRRILFARKQPPIYSNRIRPAVNGILGTLEIARSDPKGLPRNPDDTQAAEIGTKTLRYIADTSDFADVSQEVAENFFIEGTGAVIVEVDRDKIVATQIRWEEYYYDPYSRRHDLKDIQYNGVAKWKDVSDIRLRYAERLKVIGDPFGSQGLSVFGTTWDDRPEDRAWIDRRRQRCLLIEEYHLKDGTWFRCLYIASGVLEYGPSPYVDEYGQPCNPIEGVSCYIDRKNARYGIVRDMLPIQDEINSGRSRATHLNNTRMLQRVDPMAPPINESDARAEAARADGVLPPGYQLVPGVSDTMANANLLRMQEAKSEIERMSPTPLARDLEGGTAISGRARLVAQNASNAENARPLARLKGWRLRVYQQMWNRARQFWTAPMWIRVTDEVRAPDFLQLNEPQMGMVMQQMQAPDGSVVNVPSIGVTGYKNRPAEIGMDIILDETPDTAALQEEIFAELMELIRIGVSPFSPEFELLIEMAPLTDKTRILERLKAKREEVQQSQAEAAQRAQQMAEAQAAEDIRNKAADTEKKTAETAQIEVQTMVTAFEAGQSSVPEPKEPAKAPAKQA